MEGETIGSYNLYFYFYFLLFHILLCILSVPFRNKRYCARILFISTISSEMLYSIIFYFFSRSYKIMARVIGSFSRTFNGLDVQVME